MRNEVIYSNSHQWSKILMHIDFEKTFFFPVSTHIPKIVSIYKKASFKRNIGKWIGKWVIYFVGTQHTQQPYKLDQKNSKNEHKKLINMILWLRLSYASNHNNLVACVLPMYVGITIDILCSYVVSCIYIFRLQYSFSKLSKSRAKQTKQNNTEKIDAMSTSTMSLGKRIE